jgi:hypothetical protein
MSFAGLLACIRAPKSGSKSLTRMLDVAFADRGRHYLPDTYRPETRISRWQAFRLWRSQTQNLRARQGVWTLDEAFRKIDAAARPGDLLQGGHFDHATAAAGLTLPVKSIVMLREPAERSRSEYNYARQGFLKRPPWSRFDAHLVAQAAGRYDFAGFLDYQLDHAEVFGDLVSGYLGWRPGQSYEAFRETVWCWGVLDGAAAFTARLSALTGKPLEMPRHNVTARVEQTEVSAAERARIERLYARDLELYARCRAEDPA